MLSQSWTPSRYSSPPYPPNPMPFPSLFLDSKYKQARKERRKEINVGEKRGKKKGRKKEERERGRKGRRDRGREGGKDTHAKKFHENTKLETIIYKKKTSKTKKNA